MGHNLETLDDADLGWSWLEMRGSEIVIVKVDAGEVESIVAAFKQSTDFRIHQKNVCEWITSWQIFVWPAPKCNVTIFTLSLSLSLSLFLFLFLSLLSSSYK